jgi:hypothetical protein
MSDDILSGGAIDPSTSGPIPPSEDDRSRDILSEQKGRQDQDAIGGTQLPPRPQPPPEIQEIAPPLPPIDFNISGLDLEGTKEIARQTVVDVLKNVTINGQGPSVDGSSIAFNVSQEQSASESFGNIAQAARNAARQNGADIGFDDAQTARDAARQGGADISFNDAQAARDAARQKGADIDSDDAQAARDDAREGRSSARAYKAAEEERKERKESDPNFDRESYVRQKGETPTEFRERQEQLRQERVERAQREEQLSRVRTGDFTEMPSGIIPVRLTRADGNKKILALIATDFVGVVEGASGLDRPATLPSEDSYYEGGGGDCFGLALYTKTVGTPPNTTTEVWVGAGTVAGQLPSGFDPEEGKNIASSGSGSVWAEVNIDGTTGDIVSVAVTGGGTTPNNTDTSFYYALGYYEYDGVSASVTNYGCGSLDATICRNWFAAEAPFYGVTINRCGCGSGY